MLVRLDGDGPLSTQLYAAVRRMILAGGVAAGTRLPSSRSLARELGVSRNTVLLAYEQLLAEGYVAGRGGSGTYVTGGLVAPDRGPAATRPERPRVSAYARRLPPAPEPPVPGRLPYDFRYGVPADDPYPGAVWRRLLSRRARGATALSLSYGPPEGIAPLREAIAAYASRARGVVCNASQVIVVNGSQQALDLAARVLLDAGDRVVIEEPQYQGARWVFAAADARLVAIPVDGEGLMTDRLPITGAGLAYVTPSHQFPTGVFMSLPRRLALLAWAGRHRAWVLEDDYDSEYRYEGRPIEAVQGLDREGRVIYIGTLSKVLFPALRIGYLIVPGALVESFRSAKWATDRHTPTLTQEVLADFIRDGHFERHLRRARLRHASRRAALLDALERHVRDDVEVIGANAGVHLVVWLRHLPRAALAALVSSAAASGVGVYPVDPYYLRRPARAGLMLGYAALDEPRIEAGVARLAAVIAATRAGRSRGTAVPRARR
jgi:GntR family transcriptional regulator/MocR family aminotransferase